MCQNRQVFCCSEAAWRDWLVSCGVRWAPDTCHSIDIEIGKAGAVSGLFYCLPQMSRRQERRNLANYRQV
jgi:hypothetical protein